MAYNGDHDFNDNYGGDDDDDDYCVIKKGL